MKRFFLVITILTAAAALPPLLPNLPAEGTWSLSTGLNFTPALVYNRSWDPGYSGSALTMTLTHQSGTLLLGAGAEAGYSYTGINLLFLLQAGLILAEDDKLQFSAAAALMPGLILSRPSPFFLFAAELTARLKWKISPVFSLSLITGPRYTWSPDYSAKVAPLESIDLSIGLIAGFVLGSSQPGVID